MTEIGEAMFAELQTMEPPLARVFRDLAAKGKFVTVCSIDGTTVKGKIIDVAEDGSTATVDHGDAAFVFDISAVSVIKIEH